jgi:hypothetical protein
LQTFCVALPNLFNARDEVGKIGAGGGNRT